LIKLIKNIEKIKGKYQFRLFFFKKNYFFSMDTEKTAYTAGLRHFLNRRNITLDDLAKEIGCKRSALGMVANGSARPTYDKCKALLKAGMTISELFGDDVVVSHNDVSQASPQDMAEFVRRGLLELAKRSNQVPVKE
jgi:transcriptional regulator with XRE-family HTH domain